MENMTAQELGTALWNCGNELHKIMEPNDYKDYLLCLIFYKALSDNELYAAVNLIEDRDPKSLDEAQTIYENLVGTEDWNDLQKELEDQFKVAIQPNQTFNAFIKAINNKTFLLSNLKEAFNVIEKANGNAYSDLFDDFDIYSKQLGKTDKKRNTVISSCMKQLNAYDFNFYHNKILSNAFEYLITKFAETSGKVAGKFYTPKMVSKIISRIVTKGKENTDGFSIYEINTQRLIQFNEATAA